MPVLICATFVELIQKTTIEERVTILETQVVEIEENITGLNVRLTEVDENVDFLFDEEVIQDETFKFRNEVRWNYQ